MALCTTIKQYLSRSDWDGLTLMLSKRSNSELRSIERIIRSDIMPTMNNAEFWSTFRFFVLFRPQGFLPCVSNIKHLASDGTLNFQNSDVEAIATTLSAENIKKLIYMALPHLATPEQIDNLFEAFRFSGCEKRAIALIHVTTPLGYYKLFDVLKNNSDDRVTILRCCRFLIKQQNDMAYNMASILTAYFGLEEIKTKFSLKIAPYELSYLDKSPENFYYILDGKRPKVDI